MTLSLAHRRAFLTWRSAEVVNLYLLSLQIYACSNIFSKNIFLQKLSLHVHVLFSRFFNSVDIYFKIMPLVCKTIATIVQLCICAYVGTDIPSTIILLIFNFSFFTIYVQFPCTGTSCLALLTSTVLCAVLTT
jgi:hypothetical protein